MRKLFIFLAAIVLISLIITASYFFIINYTESQNKKEILATEQSFWTSFSEMRWGDVVDAYQDPIRVIGAKNDTISHQDLYDEIDTYYSKLRIETRSEMLRDIKTAYDWDNVEILNFKKANTQFKDEIQREYMDYFQKGDYILVIKTLPSTKNYEGRTAVYRKINNEWKIIASTL